MATKEYLRICLIIMLATCVASLPSSYLSSMTEGEEGGMTWMGWAPQTGMTAFASSSNPWANNGWKTTGVKLDPPAAEHPQHSAPANKPRSEEQPHAPGTSNAQASLNAWFPIMLGLFPPQDSLRNNQNDPQGSSGSITAVANSVNHGSRGVASSHAVAYGGEYPKFRHLAKDNNNSNQYGAQTRQYKPLFKPSNNN